MLVAREPWSAVAGSWLAVGELWSMARESWSMARELWLVLAPWLEARELLPAEKQVSVVLRVSHSVCWDHEKSLRSMREKEYL